MKRMMQWTVIPAIIALAACANLQTNVGKTLDGLSRAVESARYAYVRHVNTYGALESDVAKYEALYEKYQAGFAFAELIYRNQQVGLATDAEWEHALRAVSESGAQLIALVQAVTADEGGGQL